MDLSKIGKFIQQQRKAKNLTQVELAQKINVSEKTISKWECGNGFPDTSLMLPLCEVLEISANELLCGKLIKTEKEYKQSAEQNLISLKAQQEKNTKHLLTVEYLIIWLSMVILLACTIIPAYIEMPLIWKIFIIVFGFLNMIVSIAFSIVIETKAGFYECSHYHHKYVPSYKQVLWSMHVGRTRYITCPKCNKKNWSKKTINGD